MPTLEDVCVLGCARLPQPRTSIDKSPQMNRYMLPDEEIKS